MGNTNQAEADRTPTQEDEVNSVTTADDYEAFADQIAQGRGEAAKFAAEDKALSDEDEERFDDPDEEKAVDPDAEGEDEAEADEQSDDAGEDDDADGEEDGEGEDSAGDSDDADADDADSDDDGEDADDKAKAKDDDDDDGDDDAAEDDAGAKRFRVRASDKVEVRALELKKRNRDMTLAECLERAQRELNPDAGKGEGGDDAEGAKVETPESLEAEIERLSGEAEKAFTDDLDFDRGRELQKEIIALSKKLSKVRADDAGADTLRQAEAARQAAADAERKAVELYDFVTDPKHPGVKLMEEIDQRLKDEGDPLFNDPAKALAIARMAARELGIAPRGKRRAEVVVKQPGKAPKKNSPVSIAGGSARTQAKSNEGEAEAEIEKVSSVDDYEALIYGT